MFGDIYSVGRVILWGIYPYFSQFTFVFRSAYFSFIFFSGPNVSGHFSQITYLWKFLLKLRGSILIRTFESLLFLDRPIFSFIFSQITFRAKFSGHFFFRSPLFEISRISFYQEFQIIFHRIFHNTAYITNIQSHQDIRQ